MKRLVAAAGLLVPALAAAQPGNYYAQPPQPVSQPAVEPEPRVHLDLAILAAAPRGDWKEQLAGETSPGFQLRVGTVVAPNISVFGGVRYVRVNYDEARLATSDLRLSHRELQLGVRVIQPIAPAAKLFFEGDVHSATMTASFDGGSESESGVGLGARTGLMLLIDRKIALSFAVGFSTADIDLGGDGEDFQDAWLTGDAGVTFLF